MHSMVIKLLQVLLAICCASFIFVLCGCNNDPGYLVPDKSSIHFKRTDGVPQTVVPLVLTNVGDTVVHIAEIKSPCSCTVVGEPTRKAVSPGASTEIELELSPPLYGSSSTSVTVVSDSEVEPYVKVQVHLEGNDGPIPRIVSQTKVLELYFDGQESEKICDVEFRTIEVKGESNWISSVGSLSDDINVRQKRMVEEFPLSEEIVDRLYVFEVAVSRPSGSGLFTTIEPKLSSAVGQESSINQIPVSAVCRSLLRAVPPRVIITDTGQRERQLIILSTDGADFGIKSANVVNGEEYLSVLGYSDGQASRHDLSVNIDGDNLGSRENECAIEIETTRSDDTIITVPVLFE